jgi:hypothetical protein
VVTEVTPAEVLERHFTEPAPDERPLCFEDDQPWPCDAVQMARRAEELEKALREMRPDHPKDGYAYAGCFCADCERVRQSYTPGLHRQVAARAALRPTERSPE